MDRFHLHVNSDRNITIIAILKQFCQFLNQSAWASHSWFGRRSRMDVRQRETYIDDSLRHGLRVVLCDTWSVRTDWYF